MHRSRTGTLYCVRIFTYCWAYLLCSIWCDGSAKRVTSNLVPHGPTGRVSVNETK
jgi:hypothetical protein